MIKKCGFFIVAITLLFSLVACGKTSLENETQTSVSTSIPTQTSTPTSTKTTSSTTSTTPTTSPKVVPVSEITALDVAEKLFDKRLSASQRKEIWQQEYEGMHIRWYVQHHFPTYSTTDIKNPGTESTIGLEIEWLPGEYSKDIMKQFNETGVFILDGTLNNYYSTGFEVKEAKLDSPVLKYMWECEAILINEGSYISEGVLAAVDQKYIYSWQYNSPGYYYKDTVYDWEGKIYIFDKTNGYFVSEVPFKFSNTHDGLLRGINDKINSMAQGQLVFAQHEFPFETRLDNFTFKFYKYYDYFFVDCYETTTNYYLWGFTFDRGGRNSLSFGALVLDRTIFISKGAEIQAYQLQ